MCLKALSQWVFNPVGTDLSSQVFETFRTIDWIDFRS